MPLRAGLNQSPQSLRASPAEKGVVKAQPTPSHSRALATNGGAGWGVRGAGRRKLGRRLLLRVTLGNVRDRVSVPPAFWGNVRGRALGTSAPAHSLGHYWWKQPFCVFGTGCDRLSARLETEKNVLSDPSRQQHPHSHPSKWLPQGHRGRQNRQHSKNGALLRPGRSSSDSIPALRRVLRGRPRGPW